MHVYCNFYCSPAKKQFSDPHFFGAGDATYAQLISLGYDWLSMIWSKSEYLKDVNDR